MGDLESALLGKMGVANPFMENDAGKAISYRQII